MPGIYGIVSEDWNGLSAGLAGMRRALTVGFEKASECWIDEASGAGFGRESLGVYDLGNQPVVNNTGNLILILDGVLYDTQGLRRDLIARGYPAKEASQSSLAMFAYEAYGPAGFAHLQGIFILVIWDKTQRKLILANDRFGLRPFYYSRRGNCFAFATEVKALLDLEFVDSRVNDAAFSDLFAFGHLFGDKTLFEHIHLMKPASILAYQEGSWQTENYWRVNFVNSKISRHEDDWAEEMVELLVKSVRRRIDIWPDMGLSLSGGLDSRTLLAVATQSLDALLPTYAYGFADSKDIAQARKVARRKNVPHRESILTSDYLSANADRMVGRTEGLLNCLESHGFNLLEMVPTDQVIILGTGAENLFSTVRSYFKFSFIEGEDPVYTFFKVINRIFQQDEWPELFSEKFFRRIEGRAFQSLSQVASQYQGCSPDDLVNSIEWDATQRNWFQGIYMINHCLEYCIPYYDYDLVDFALTLPLDLRWGRKLQKLALCRISPDLAKSPGGPMDVDSSYRKLWNRFMNKGKRVLKRIRHKTNVPQLTKPAGSFTDLHSLLRSSNRKWVEMILLDERTLGRDYFQPKAIRRLVEDHMNGKRNIGLQLGILITFELWHRQFVD